MMTDTDGNAKVPEPAAALPSGGAVFFSGFIIGGLIRFRAERSKQVKASLVHLQSPAQPAFTTMCWQVGAALCAFDALPRVAPGLIAVA